MTALDPQGLCGAQGGWGGVWGPHPRGPECLLELGTQGLCWSRGGPESQGLAELSQEEGGGDSARARSSPAIASSVAAAARPSPRAAGDAKPRALPQPSTECGKADGETKSKCRGALIGTWTGAVLPAGPCALRGRQGQVARAARRRPSPGRGSDGLRSRAEPQDRLALDPPSPASALAFLGAPGPRAAPGRPPSTAMRQMLQPQARCGRCSLWLLGPRGDETTGGNRVTAMELSRPPTPRPHPLRVSPKPAPSQWPHLAPRGSFWFLTPPQPNSATSWLGLPPWLLLEDAYSSFKHFPSVPSPKAFPDPSLHCPSSGLSLHPGCLWDLSRAMMLGFCPGLSSHYPCSWQVPRDPEEGLLEHACHVLQLSPGGSIHPASEATAGGLGGPPLEGGAGATWDTGRPLPGPQVPSMSGRGGAGWLLRAPRIIKDGKTGGQAHRLGTQKLPLAPQARPGRRTSPPQARLPCWEPVWPERGGTPRGPGRLTLARPLVRQQLVPLPAATLEAAHGVAAEVVAASIVDQALVDVCGAGRQDEAKRVGWAALPGPPRSPGRAQEGGLAHSRGGGRTGDTAAPRTWRAWRSCTEGRGTGVCGAGPNNRDRDAPMPFHPRGSAREAGRCQGSRGLLPGGCDSGLGELLDPWGLGSLSVKIRIRGAPTWKDITRMKCNNIPKAPVLSQGPNNSLQSRFIAPALLTGRPRPGR